MDFQQNTLHPHERRRRIYEGKAKVLSEVTGAGAP